jgi:hypothetical protein
MYQLMILSSQLTQWIQVNIGCGGTCYKTILGVWCVISEEKLDCLMGLVVSVPSVARNYFFSKLCRPALKHASHYSQNLAAVILLLREADHSNLHMG